MSSSHKKRSLIRAYWWRARWCGRRSSSSCSRVGSAGGVSGGGRSAGGRDGDAGGPAGERPQLLRGEPLRASVGAAVGDHCTEATARNGGSQKSTLVNRSAQAFGCAIPE